MTFKLGGSLSRKLRWAMLLTTLVALVVALAAMLAYDLGAYHADWEVDLRAQAELLGRTSAPALRFNDTTVAQDNLALLRLQPKVRAAALYDLRGQLFASYLPGTVAGGLPARLLPSGVQGDGVHVDQGDLVVWQRIVEGDEVLGTVFLRAEYEMVDRVINYAGIALLVAGIGMGVAFLMASWLQTIVIGPISAIGATAREVVSQGDYSRRVDKRSNDELGTLVDAFNEMMGEIERRTQALEASNRDKAREVEERREAQQEVMHLNEALEGRVSERTAQLESSNRELALATTAAELANRAKSEFLSNMSHELRTPLNAIIGFGQLLAAAETPLPPERQRAFVEHIVNAGHHLLSLINDILNLAQIEAGKLSLSVESVDLDGLLDECRSMTEPLAVPRGLRLHFPPAGMPNVMADRTRLRQVLLNLLSNAVKYNCEQGAIVVACASPTPGRVRISVRDTGPGLRPEQVGALFQPFNRLGQERGMQEGAGIGLVVTRHLVELMGGEMGVSSTPGTGSLFWVELRAGDVTPPVEASPPQAVVALPELPADATPGDQVTVLCVEDNAASLRLIEEALRLRPGLRVVVATDGQKGVEMARLHRPDVILMDNNMPVLTGAQAQALLRADPRTAGIPVIAISANAMPSAVAEGLAAGFFRYLTKPISLVELFDALDGALESNAQRDAARPPSV